MVNRASGMRTEMMSDTLPFSSDLVQFLVDHREPALTIFLQAATFLGEIEGYVLIVAFIYVAYDKRLAFRLAAMVLVTMSLNHLLKLLLGNARPFVTDGTYLEKWAVSAEKARELVVEYSTPSGHAMSAVAFYVLLFVSVNNRGVRVLAIAAIALTGLSRPYIAVHYLEDVIIGWLVGLALVLLCLRNAAMISDLWNRRAYWQQVTIVMAASALLWSGTVLLNGGKIQDQPLAFIAYAGLLTGIVIAYPLEREQLNFDPRSATLWRKTLRFHLSVAVLIATLLGLDWLFERIADDSTLLGHALQYGRYIAVGMIGMFFMPLLFTKLRLAGVLPRAGNFATEP
jgi:membrane-associated phospholipid phosphatase